MPAPTDNTLQKTYVQTFQASFATETSAAHLRAEGGLKDDKQNYK